MVTRQQNGNSSLEIAQSNQELVTKDRNTRRRTWLLLGLLGLVILVVVVAILAVSASGQDGGQLSEKLMGSEPPALTLEDFLEGRLVTHSFNASWISGNELIYRDSSENIVINNINTKEITILLEAEQVPHGAFDHELSPDRRYLLIGYNYQKLYSRYSFLAQYMIFDLATKNKTPLQTADNQSILQMATWTRTGNALIYIYTNNIYYRPLMTAAADIQLTGNGENGRIFNGVPDWVYEEEVLSSNRAFWFSPNSKQFAYLSLDDTKVRIMNLEVYGQAENPSFQYTKTIPLRYPKAGTPNPTVKLITIDLDAASDFRSLPRTNTLEPPLFVGSEPILSAVEFADESNLVAIWLNRIQNKAAIITCDTVQGRCETVANLEEPSGWLELFTAPKFSKNGALMFLILSQDQGGKLGSYKHLTMIERKAGGRMTPLTRGKFVVTEILAYDDEKQLVYYLATTPENPAAQHLYSVSTINHSTYSPYCISCPLSSSTSNTSCTYVVASFSTDSTHYTLNCAGPSVPETSIYSAVEHKRLEVWERNEELLELVQEKAVPTVERLEVEIGGGFKVQVQLQLPPRLDRGAGVKYPLLINVYGGPDSYAVINKFQLNWFSYLASNKSVIVASIDGRGSGLKGDRMLFAGYGHLGSVEIEDQINITRHLQKLYPFIDEKRSAIWGWSYGGYASGLALAKDNDSVFKCAISIAPVTDWTLYDSIYTERFMGIPAGDRLLAYKEASLINNVEKLRNKLYLLIHGTLDDNVHYQQSMLLAKALEINDIQFRQQTYPDEDHALASVRKHLYHTFENFLDECFEPNHES